MKPLLILLALAAAPALAQPAPDWTQRPALGPPPALTLAPVQRFALSNGLPVLVMEKRGVPLVQVDLVVRAGQVDDPAGKAGLAAFAADLMDEGAGPRDALALADAVDYLGVRLGVGAGRHSTAVTLHAPTSKLDSALALMADVALRPTFAQDELDRVRVRRLTAFEQRRDQPGAIAAVLFDRALYGPEHPYGRPVEGDPAGVRALTRADVAGWHQARVRPANAALIVVGDVEAAAMIPKLEALFGAGAWSEGRPAAPTQVQPGAQVERRTVYVVDKPGAAQSAVRIGRIGVARDTEDYFTLEVLNTLLGGSFTSRLNQNLRETHGYAYGAGSSFSYRPAPGPFLAASNVQTDATAPALTEFFNELRAIGEPTPEGDLLRARNYAALSFPQAFASVEGTAAMLRELWLYGLPDDYYGAYTGRLSAVTASELQAAARRYVDPERVAVVVVGDRARIEADVRALELGPVEVLSIEDVLGPPAP